ncbi:MAG: ATP-dependent Clp protease adaptor ClpS [Planctomycetaceae bacterium]|jgi:ATP-dependent Clp protease adaptor protein ClpS|nr:ATP-dependent Clp protease adaptor ClpS [Planctomycetaceae bacterium]
MMQQQATPDALETVTIPVKKKRRRSKKEDKPKEIPRYNVILWNDDEHSYEYVIIMLNQLFGYPVEKGFQLADTVDKQGKAIVLTTTLEHAEFKRDQIHAFGSDVLIQNCVGSMSASIEKV